MCSIDRQHPEAQSPGNAAEKDRAKRVLIEILRIAKDRRIESTRRLFKAFYYAHLYYAGEFPGYLTYWPIIKMTEGPGIGRGYELIAELVEEKKIEAVQSSYGPFPSMTYRLLNHESPELEECEIEAIRKAVQWAESMSPAELSSICHEYSKSWNQAAREGDELNIYIDLISDDEYCERAASMRRMRALLKGVVNEPTTTETTHLPSPEVTER